MPNRLLTCLLSAMLAASACGAESIRSIAEVVEAQRSQRNGASFEIAGQVTRPPAFPRDDFRITTGDSTLMLYDTRTNRCQRIAVGDHVRLSGKLEPGDNGALTHINCYGIALVAHGTLPEPRQVSISDYVGGKLDDQRVSIRGFVTDVIPDDIDYRFAYLVLADSTSSIFLICHSTPEQMAAFRALVGREVLATGNVADGSSGGRFSHLGKSFTMSGAGGIVPVAQTMPGPFDVPQLSFDCIKDPKRLAASGRRKVGGVVLAQWRGNQILMRTPDGCTVKAELASPSMPSVGETVELSGMPETDFFHVSLLRAIWRPSRLRIPADEPTVDAAIREIFTNNRGNPAFGANHFGRIIRTRGTVKSVHNDTQGRLRLLLGECGYTLFVEGEIPPDVREGCKIQVEGVCIIDSEVWRPGVVLPKVKGLELVTQNAGAVKILAGPPWWTPAKFLAVLTTLLLVIVAIYAWNMTLRALVARKSRALLREQTAKLEETLKIDERTRLAAELHDYIAQNLTVISYQVSAAESALAVNGAEAADCLKTADRMLLSCRSDLRRCLWDLKSNALNEPMFARAIEQTSEPVIGDARLLVRFAVSRSRLSDSTAHAILSICRELVSNAVRHGKADKVQIAGELKNGALRFSVRDNGCGFDPARRPGQSDGHFGLDGVAERIRRLNGQMQIDSRPGHGTLIVVTLHPKEPQI